MANGLEVAPKNGNNLDVTYDTKYDDKDIFKSVDPNSLPFN